MADSQVQVEIVASLGQFNAQMRSAAETLAQIARAGKDMGAGMAPANQAVGDLTQGFKNFRREQVQQGRLVGFYVKEIGEFAEMSKGAQSALGGFGGAMVELATGAGPLALVFAGLELVKGVIGMVREESQRAADEMKKFIDQTVKAVDAGAKAASALSGKERSRATKLGGGDAEFDAARKDALAAAKALQEFKSRFGLLGKTPESDISGISISAEQLITWAELEKKLKETAAALREYQAAKPQNDAWEQGLVSPGDAKGLEEFTKNAKAATEAAKKLRAELARMKGLEDAMLLGEEVPESDLKKPYSQLVREGDKHAEDAKAKFEKSWGAMAGPGNNAGEIEFTKDAAKEADNLSKAWTTVADSVGYAASGFAALGSAIGGAAGDMVSKMMEIVMAAIKMAVALAAASAAETPVVGWLMAAGAAAALAVTLVSTIGGVQARAMGGPVMAGETYLVGERGPELLTMGGQSGAITPNHALGGDTYVLNVSALDAASFDGFLRSRARSVRQFLREESRGRRL